MNTTPDSSSLFSADSPTFGMSQEISSGPSFVSRAMQVSSWMWIEVKRSSWHHPLGDEDRVLEVVAVPGHERDAHVLAEGQFTHVRGRAVREDVLRGDLIARTFTSGRWLMQVFWFERVYFVRL